MSEPLPELIQVGFHARDENWRKGICGELRRVRRRGASAAISRDGHLARRGEWWGSAADIMRPRAGGEFYPRRADARGLLSFGVWGTNNIRVCF